ncbi:MAG: EmrB/QacA subfamily drug resistance transporter [Candidatus Aldehydirespiratoraceae bacterium]|jgi:EmrB/QacA subfamily drug resistance transporter
MDAAWDSEQGHPKRWLILGIMCTCLVLVVAGVSSLNLAIPSIIDDLKPSSTETLWIIDGYALVFAGLLLPFGAVGDRYGRKGALLSGLVVFAGCALWASTSSTSTMLIIARGTMGIGAALVMPATLSIIISVFPLHERPKAIGAWAGFAGAGAALGIIAGGVLLESFWWGSVMLINVPIAILAAVMIASVVPSSRDEQKTPLDPVGSVLSIVGLGALVFAIIEGGENGWAQTATIGWFVGAAGFLTGWILWERRTANPMLDPALFTKAPFSLGSVSLIAGFGVMFGMFFLLTQYFQFVQGHGPLAAGVRNLPFAGTMIVVASLSPRVAARVGKRGAMTLGLALQAVGFLLFAQLTPDTAYGKVVVPLILLAAGMAMLMPAASESIVSSVPPNKAGVGSAWNDATREIGGALGIAVLGTLLSIGYRNGIEDQVALLPPEAAEAAEAGIGGAFAVAERTGLVEIIEPARQAFVDGMGLAFTAAAISSGLVALLVLARFPKMADEPVAVEAAV